MDATSLSPARLVRALLFLALCPPAANRCLAAQPLPTLAEQTAVITDRFGKSLVADIDLGLLPRGTRGVVALTLVNNSTDTIQIDRVKTNSAWLASNASAKSIEPGGKGEFEFTLETLNVAATKEISLSASLLSPDQSREVRLAMKYMIAGVLAFESPLYVGELNANAQSQLFESKIVCTAPVVPEEIEITSDPALKNVQFEIHLKDRQPVLSGTLPPNTVFNDEIAGRVVLKHAKTNQAASMDLILRKKTLPSISPSVITLRRTDSQQAFQGAAILHLDDAKDSKTDTVIQPIIDTLSSDLPLQITAKPLTRGVYKLQLSSLPHDNLLSEMVKRPIDVTMHVRSKKQPIKVATKLAFIE